MVIDLMNPLFGLFIGRLITVSCISPIHIGQILGILVLVLFTFGAPNIRVGFYGVKTCIRAISQLPSAAILLLVI